jgi:small-conductance mechanosensitive channel
MQSRFIRHSAFLVSLIVLLSMFAVDGDAKTRQKRRARRVVRPAVVRPVITNPAIAPPGAEQSPTSESERIISTADTGETQPGSEDAASQSSSKSGKNSAKTSNDSDMRQTITALSDQVDRLNDKLTQMQQNDRTLIDMEMLTRAEQRAETLRGQQVDVESKLADLEAKLEQIQYELRPENIERAAGYGTVHPEEAREARRRQLESERGRVQAQIRILQTSRERLETAVHTADAEVDTLRRKIELQQAQQNTAGTITTEPRPTRRPKP